VTTGGGESRPEGYLLADAHVHFYPHFSREAFLGAAWENLAALARDAGFSADWMPYLLLTEARGYDYFTEWKESAARGGWTFDATAETTSLLARGPGGRTLAVIRGRQIRARNGLEVLALGTAGTVPDGLDFDEALGKARADAAFVCIPWGFGKWWFARGRRVRDALSAGRGDVWLGDNAGRPRVAPDPGPFKRARLQGVPILPGTDPLPLRWHWNRAGQLAFSVAGDPDPVRPMERLVEAVGSDDRMETHGRRTGLAGFGVDQVALRVTRRRGRAS
jgi:hypothetical protein